MSLWMSPGRSGLVTDRVEPEENGQSRSRVVWHEVVSWVRDPYRGNYLWRWVGLMVVVRTTVEWASMGEWQARIVVQIRVDVVEGAWGRPVMGTPKIEIVVVVHESLLRPPPNWGRLCPVLTGQTAPLRPPGEGSGLTRVYISVSTDCGCGDDCAIVKRAGVCIPQTGSSTGG